MDIETIHTWILQNPFLAATAATTLLAFLLLFSRNIIAKSIMRFAKRTKTKVPKVVKEKRLKAKKMRSVLKRMRNVKDY